MMSNGGNEFNVKDLINRIAAITKYKPSRRTRLSNKISRLTVNKEQTSF